MTAGDPTLSEPAASIPAARPYGLVGLVVSLVLIVVGAAIVCLVVAAAAFALSLAVIGWQQTLDRLLELDPSSANTALREKIGIVGSLLAYGALCIAVLVAARIRGGATGWRAIVAWQPWNPRRGAAWVWGLAALMVVYSFIATSTIVHFVPKFEGIVQLPPGKRWAILFVLLAAVLAPAGEELLFRGWLYTSLRASFGVVAAILVVSILFALAHWESTHLYALAVFPVGLGLAWIRERTGSIKASMAVHGLYNGIASILLFFAK